MNDFLDEFPLVILLTDDAAETCAYMMIGELVRRNSFLDFVRTPVEGEVYRHPEFRT